MSADLADIIRKTHDLKHLTLFRAHDGEYQASYRPSNREGYRIEFDPDPVAALIKVLTVPAVFAAKTHELSADDLDLLG